MKTLKDIVTCPDCKAINTCKDTDEIIAAAKEWVDKLQDKIDSHIKPEDNPDPFHLKCISCRNNFVQIQWIKYFFNLEGEDESK